MIVLLLAACLAAVDCGPATESHKGQYCTDPRTMRKHAAFTEWADAYSCSRHRCQPGGRNLAIYTVGCKRVEAPESAIECEEVVEDTNMQFPFCCPRLRCLVVVRGEVWTRILGQPWETLPAAPWSHMYKMKKPPPANGTFTPKTPDQGPIFELTESESDGSRNDMRQVRSKGKGAKKSSDCNDAMPRADGTSPDIVIALSTDSDPIEKFSQSHTRRKIINNEARSNNFIEPDSEKERGPPRQRSERERDRDRDERMDTDVGDMEELLITDKDNAYNQQDIDFEHKSGSDPKQSNMQALVDAIGSRMRDMESVVQRMREKAQQPGDMDPTEKRSAEDEVGHKRHKGGVKEHGGTKKPGSEDHYMRFSAHRRGSKYLHGADSATEPPAFSGDTKMNGYFSDASNIMLRLDTGPKGPVQTYMAPVETRRRASPQASDASEEKKHKNHHHKKKKGKHHKKHHNKQKFNRLTSAEVEKNLVSLEDSNLVGV